MARMIVLVSLAVAGCSQQPTERATAPQPTATPTADAIPAKLQGRWALAPTDCDPAIGDARGLLTIGGDAFAFGVAPVTVSRVILRPDRVVFDTGDPGGGVSESRRYVFLRSADGRRLTRENDPLPDQVYTRCPDRPS